MHIFLYLYIACFKALFIFERCFFNPFFKCIYFTQSIFFVSFSETEYQREKRARLSSDDEEERRGIMGL